MNSHFIYSTVKGVCTFALGQLLLFIVTTQASNGETKAGKKGFPVKAKRKVDNTFCPFFLVVEI